MFYTGDYGRLEPLNIFLCCFHKIAQIACAIGAIIWKPGFKGQLSYWLVGFEVRKENFFYPSYMKIHGKKFCALKNRILCIVKLFLHYFNKSFRYA